MAMWSMLSTPKRISATMMDESSAAVSLVCAEPTRNRSGTSTDVETKIRVLIDASGLDDFRKDKLSLAQAACAAFLDHHGIAAADRVGCVARHRSRFKHKDIALDQGQIEMLCVSRARVHIAFDLAGDLRPIFTDAAAVQQHPFRRMARLAHELLIKH